MRPLMHTDSAPAVPLTEATTGAGLIFTSGQLPRRADGTVPDGFGQQVTQTLDNLESALDRAGSSFAGLLKVTVYLCSLDDFEEYNEIYRGRLQPTGFPARTTVEVSRFRGACQIEMDAIAIPVSPSAS